VNVLGGRGSKFVAFQLVTDGSAMTSDVVEISVTVTDSGDAGTGDVVFNVDLNLVEEIYYQGSALYTTFFPDIANSTLEDYA